MGIKDDVRVPEVLQDYCGQLEKGLCAKIVRVVTPTTASKVTTSAAWSRDVRITYQDALSSNGGKIHTWFQGKVYASITDDFTATAKIASTEYNVVDGAVTITVYSTGGACAATKKDTLTIKEQSILGVTLSTQTSIQTFTT